MTTIRQRERTNYGMKEHLEEEKGVKTDIANVYKNLIEKKRDYFIKEECLSENLFEECLAYHRKLALNVAFDERERQLFSCYHTDPEVRENDALKMEILEKVDDAFSIPDKKFTEYFIAETLMIELELGNRDANFQKLLVEKIFSEQDFKTTRIFLDSRLRNTVDSLPGDIFQEYQNSNSSENCNFDLLHLLAEEGTTQIMKLIFKCIDFEIITDKVYSIEDNYDSNIINVIKHLLKKGGVNIKDKYGMTLLHHAASGGHLEVVQFLTENGAKADILDNEGETPLHRAAWEKHLDIVERLVKLGVDVDIKDETGDTALLSAAWRGCFDTAKRLVTLGADINFVGDDNNTPLILAASRGHLDLVQFLLELGANISAKDACGDTPLHLATSRGHLDTVKFLAARGADPHARDNDGQTPIHLAAISGELEIAKFLVSLAVDVLVVDNKKRTPLHFAAREGHLDLVKFFVQLGVDADVKEEEEGLTPRELAQLEGHWETVEFLEGLLALSV